MRHRRSYASRQDGVALFIGLVFLVVLSIVAVLAMKGTLIEMRMVTNAARHEQAFETSEALRGVPVDMFDQHVFARGWPASMGGAVPNSDFDFTHTMPATLLSKVVLDNDCGNAKTLLYGQLQPGCGALVQETLYDPSTWHPDMQIAICDTDSTGCSTNVSAVISVVPDGTVLAAGAGGAQAAGYRGLGIGSAGGGGQMFFEMRAVATVPGNGTATTHTQYRQTISN
jgi:PilX N-terminal